MAILESQPGYVHGKEAASMPYTIEDRTRLIAKRNFCILVTQGLHAPHVAEAGYFASGLDIYVPTSGKTTKARNVRRDSRVAVQIPVPWPLLPAPPRSIQFRGHAEILPIENADANAALARASPVMRRVFRRLMENAETEAWAENIWIHVRPVGRIETFMVGVPLTTIFRDEKKAMLHFTATQPPVRTGEA